MELDEERIQLRESIQFRLKMECERIRHLAAGLGAHSPPELRYYAERVVAVATCPTCTRSQADGAPCLSAREACSECGEALKWVRQLRIRLEESARARQVPPAEFWEI